MRVAGDADHLDRRLRRQNVREKAAHECRVVDDQHSNAPLRGGLRLDCGLGHGILRRAPQSKSSTSPPPAALLPMLARYNCSWWLIVRFSTGRSLRIRTRPLAG